MDGDEAKVVWLQFRMERMKRQHARLQEEMRALVELRKRLWQMRRLYEIESMDEGSKELLASD